MSGPLRSAARWVLRGQGVYYVLTGAWPLFSLRSFEWVTGPKNDDWLVQTVGVLAIVIGTTLLVGAWQEHLSVETRVLSVGTAAGFAAVDVVFVLGGRISTVYLADALVELLVVGSGLAWWRRVSGQPTADHGQHTGHR